MTSQVSSMSQTSVQRVVFILIFFTLVIAVSGITNCYKGEYAADVRKDGAHKCLECPEDTYMDKHDNTEPKCFNCTAPSNDGSEKVIAKCNAKHDAQIGCANGYYNHTLKGSEGCKKLWVCLPCTKHCKHEGRPCSQTSNAVCCEYANMIVVDELGGPRCVNSSKESSSKVKEDQLDPITDENETGSEHHEDQLELVTDENETGSEHHEDQFVKNKTEQSISSCMCCSKSAAIQRQYKGTCNIFEDVSGKELPSGCVLVDSNSCQKELTALKTDSQENRTVIFEILIAFAFLILVPGNIYSIIMIFKKIRQCLSGRQASGNEILVRNSGGSFQECLEGSGNISLEEIVTTVQGRNHQELDNHVNEGTGLLENPENKENKNGTETEDHACTQSNVNDEEESGTRNGMLVVGKSKQSTPPHCSQSTMSRQSQGDTRSLNEEHISDFRLGSRDRSRSNKVLPQDVDLDSNAEETLPLDTEKGDNAV